jgi:hypothetical protein
MLSALVWETPRGNDLALANLVAAFGGAAIMNVSLPGREYSSSHPDIWTLAGENLLGFAEGNLWNEFKPDLKHLVSKGLHPRR